MSGLTVSNIFLSFQNWVVTHASPDQRPIHAGLFNTIAAVISLVSPFLGGTIVQEIGYQPLFVFSLLMAFAALYMMLRFVHE